jgi:effector-binding domain-containing protein
MIDTPHITQSAKQATAVIRFMIPRDEIRTVMGPGYRELMDAVAAQGLTPAGQWFSHHFRMNPDFFDFEIGVPLAAPITPVGRVEASELPATTVVRTTFHGNYEGLPAAWGEFDAWIADRGLATAQDLWECYVAGPESSPDPAAWRTELNRPLAG